MINKIKIFLAKVMGFTRISDFGLLLLNRRSGCNYIRAINYHDTPASSASNFEKQLQFYQQYFSPVTFSDLESFFNEGAWKKDKPGLIISFDDGHLSNYETALPLLEKYGFTGWFFVPAGFLYTKGKEQVRIFEDKAIMSWEDAIDINKNHVIGCHTMNHHRMTKETTEEQMEEEIAQSRLLLEEKLQCPIDIFCWCGGDFSSYSSSGANYIAKTGYSYVFMTNSAPILKGTHKLHLQRTNIETGWPIELVKFQLSGIMDILYFPKRVLINRITKIAQ